MKTEEIRKIQKNSGKIWQKPQKPNQINKIPEKYVKSVDIWQTPVTPDIQMSFLNSKWSREFIHSLNTKQPKKQTQNYVAVVVFDSMAVGC